MGIPIVPTVIAGGVGYAVLRKSGAAPGGPGAQKLSTPAPGATGSGLGKPGTISGPRSGVVSFGAVGPSPTYIQTTQPGSSRSMDPNLQMALDQAKAEAQQQFANMDDVAKGQAADYLNTTLQPPPNPPLNGHEDWDTVASAISGAAGAAAGSAICGPVCGEVGAMVSAYLGKELYDYLVNKLGDEIESWFSGTPPQPGKWRVGRFTPLMGNDCGSSDGETQVVFVDAHTYQLDPKHCEYWIDDPKQPPPIPGKTSTGGSLEISGWTTPTKSSQSLGIPMTSAAGTFRY